MRKKGLMIGLVILSVFVLSSILVTSPVFAASKDKPIVWKVQTPWPQALWQHKAAVIWAEDVEKLSGREVERWTHED